METRCHHQEETATYCHAPFRCNQPGRALFAVRLADDFQADDDDRTDTRQCDQYGDQVPLRPQQGSAAEHCQDQHGKGDDFHMRPDAAVFLPIAEILAEEARPEQPAIEQ